MLKQPENFLFSDPSLSKSRIKYKLFFPVFQIFWEHMIIAFFCKLRKIRTCSTTCRVLTDYISSCFSGIFLCKTFFDFIDCIFYQTNVRNYSINELQLRIREFTWWVLMCTDCSTLFNTCPVSGIPNLELLDLDSVKFILSRKKAL